MRAKIFLLLMLLSVVVFSVSGCPITPDCPGCQLLQDALQASMFLSVDSAAYNISATLYYENLTASPPRQPIKDAVVIVHAYNESFKETYLIYTDNSGVATFDFTAYKDRSLNFKFLYCPFTCPGSSQCGFLHCLNYSGIDCPLPTCNVTDINEAPGETAPSPLNCPNLLPTLQTASYSPPPPKISDIPAICLPLMILFAILGGSLFLSGRNPFAGFDFTAPRLGRHIRYQARGRGFSLSAPTFVTQWVMGKVGDAVASGAGKVAGAIAETTGGKKGKAQAKAIKAAIKGEGGGAGMAIKVGGQVIQIGGGRRKGRKGKATMMDYIVGGPITPWAKYSRHIEKIKRIPISIKEVGAVIPAINMLAKGADISYESAHAHVLSTNNLSGASAALRKAAGPNFSCNVVGVNDNGLLVDGKGNAIEIKTPAGDAVVRVDMKSARLGFFKGSVIVEGKEFSIQPATEGVVGISPAWDVKVFEGKQELTGTAKESAIKSIDVDKIVGQVGNHISLETSMFSEQLGGQVKVKLKPLGDFQNFEVTTKDKVVVKVENYNVTSITGATGAAQKEIGGTDIKIGTDMGNTLVKMGEVHEANNKFVAASKAYSDTLTNIAGETYMAKHPEYKQKLTDYRNNATEMIKTSILPNEVKDFMIHQKIDHIGIARSSDEVGFRTLADSPTASKAFKAAVRNYNGAITPPAEGGPTMPKKDAYTRYIKPLESEIKKPENFKVYKQAYDTTQSQEYGKLAGNNEDLRHQLKANADSVANIAASSRESLPEPLREHAGNISVHDLYHPEDPKSRKKIDMQSAYSFIGESLAKPGAESYMRDRENPQKLSPSSIFSGFRAGKGVREGTAISIDPGKHKKLSQDLKDVTNVLTYAGTLKGKKKDEFMFKATYNLRTEAENARKGLAKQEKGKTKPGRSNKKS